MLSKADASAAAEIRIQQKAEADLILLRRSVEAQIAQGFIPCVKLRIYVDYPDSADNLRQINAECAAAGYRTERIVGSNDFYVF